MSSPHQDDLLLLRVVHLDLGRGGGEGVDEAELGRGRRGQIRGCHRPRCGVVLLVVGGGGAGGRRPDGGREVLGADRHLEHGSMCFPSVLRKSRNCIMNKLHTCIH